MLQYSNHSSHPIAGTQEGPTQIPMLLPGTPIFINLVSSLKAVCQPPAHTNAGETGAIRGPRWIILPFPIPYMYCRRKMFSVSFAENNRELVQLAYTTIMFCIENEFRQCHRRRLNRLAAVISSA